MTSDKFTYKGQYHFTNKYGIVDKEHLPSVDAAPDINSTIKENPYVANVEVEKDEIVLDPDYQGLFKVVGKRHHQGGTPTYLKGGSFIYSDFNKIKLKKEDFEEMDMQYHKDMTPAEAVKKYVDPKKYNTIIANLTDRKTDFIKKNSSMLMLEKHLGSLGRIAYLQEKKKGFEQGLPPITENAAPVYEEELKEELDMQKQYMKTGGLVKYQSAGSIPAWLKPFSKANTKQGRLSPTDRDVTIPTIDDNELYGSYNKWKGLNNNKDFENMKELQTFMYNHFEKNDPNVIQNMWKDWGNTNTGENIGNIPPGLKAFADNYGGGRTLALMNAINGVRNTTPVSLIEREPIKGLQVGDKKFEIPQVTTDVKSQQANPEIDPENYKDIPWEFTPWQKANQAYNLSRLAGLKRYMPARAQVRPSYMEEQLVNPEQTVSDLKAGYNTMLDSSRVMNPYLAGSQMSQAYGKYMEQVPQVRSQYDNNNAQIVNNTRGMNTQIANNTRLQNMQNDARYYQEAITGLSNFDNMKGLMRDRYMEGVMQDVSDNQNLAFMMATERDPAWTFDYKSGRLKRLPKSILNSSYQGEDDMMSKYQAMLMSNLQNMDPTIASQILAHVVSGTRPRRNSLQNPFARAARNNNTQN
jgi:hypothetical protein